jgi:hypothetical protein
VIERSLILVEGDSDRIALETLAIRLGRRLEAQGVDIVSMDGVTNLGAHLKRFTADCSVVVLCDDRESATVRRVVESAGLAKVHIEVCVADLEDELIRAIGPAGVQQVIDGEGELSSFRALQQMPAQRARTVDEHLRRFVGSKSGRKAKYARLLVNALDLARVPEPLTRTLAAALSPPSAP